MQQNKGNTFTQTQDQVTALLYNDEKIIEQLYKTNFLKAAQFISNNGGTEEEAKDIYQEAFIAAWQNVRAGKFIVQEGSSLEAYIFQVTKFKWFDHLKKNKQKKMVALQDEGIADNVYSEEEYEYIEKVKLHFSKLGEQCRQVLTLFYFKKQSMNKIASVYSWTDATAKNNKYRCLQRLREMVAGKQ